jgi:hypothetical protein
MLLHTLVKLGMTSTNGRDLAESKGPMREPPHLADNIREDGLGSSFSFKPIPIDDKDTPSYFFMYS